MTARPRIDLDGVDLADLNNADMIVAIFRYRTVEGLLFLIPESADVLVEWRHVEEATLDLKGGQMKIRLAADYVRGQNWLRGATTLVGKWLDRYTMK